MSGLIGYEAGAGPCPVCGYVHDGPEHPAEWHALEAALRSLRGDLGQHVALETARRAIVAYLSVPTVVADRHRAEELVRWADTYGEPEEWAKRAQDAHARAECAEAELEVVREELRDAHDEILTHGESAE